MTPKQYGLIAIALSSVLAVHIVAEAMDVYAPSSRRWPVNTGMELPMVTILDENGYYATLKCTVSDFNQDNVEKYTYDLSCTDAPPVITVGSK